MRANPAINMPSGIAVKAKNLEIRWESVAYDPTSQVLSRHYVLPVFITSPIYMVDR